MSEVSQLLKQIAKEMGKNEEMVQNFIESILSNVLFNPENPTFKKIKKSSNVYNENILPIVSMTEILKLAHFQECQEFIFLADNDVNINLLTLLVEQVNLSIQESSISNFNPYQSYSWGTSGISNNKIAEKEGFVCFYDELQKLQRKRDELMNVPIKDRKLKVYILNQFSQKKTQNIVNEDYEETQDKSNLLKDQLKKFIQQNLENQQFSSKSKQEYDKLLNTPLYTQTTIRIKFPNNIILEALFCPKETIKDVIDIVAKHLENPNIPFYLFTTPPRTIMDKRYYEKTLDDQGCLPGANFYFGIDDQQLLSQYCLLRKDLIQKLKQ
ncbi:hypothetical protein IMG5_098100 [Ichthyophthirius multifiliis]|uniref:UBX domain-containing protein n=1 Tax=Ichthyophthirius multifiliis TaxID=5932 RepID=G0QS15_ICHMU|nr:hypothetical protein IMG5_098100 [Ichthyophthirius multifiliis]EGR31984.1 hypothetical protein IMG5_098100 [Ichthyophthirius multifiliis]|eukprot:XP_004035470.1 hypothetical protein IMG5_098100 [Ichthyophthirius multifiliis]